MKDAASFRAAARSAFAGNCGIAILASIIVSILGGGGAS